MTQVLSNKIHQLSSIINRYSHIIISVGIMLFVFYIFSQRWFELYLQSRSLQVLLVGFALFLILIGVEKNLFLKKLTIIDFLWFIAVAIIIINIILVDVTEYYLDIFVFIVGFIFIVITKVYINTFKNTFHLIKAISFLYAAGTIMQFLYTETFNNILFKFTTSYSQESISKLVSRNYYPGFGFGRTAISGYFISTGLGLLCSFWGKNKSRVFFAVSAVFFVFLLTALFITGKRSILLWVLISLPLTFIILGKGSEMVRRFITALIFIAICLLSLLILSKVNSIPFITRIENLVSIIASGEPSGSILYRLNLFQQAWVFFVDNPWFGIGWRQFEVVTTGWYSSNYDVHNLYLQLLCEVGIIGFIVVMTPIIYTYMKTIQAIRFVLHEDNVIYNAWKYGLAFSLFYQTLFMLHAFADSVFRNIMFFLMYFFVISITNSYLVYKDKNINKKGLTGREQES